jgi:AcrR family transcriptional regulator
MRDKIIESAIRQIKSYGLRRFTVDDIVKDLRISKKTLYQHFSSKKELIGTVLDTAIELEKRITDEALVNGGDWFEKLDAILSVHSYTNIPYRLMDEIARFFPEERAYVDRIVEYKAKVLRELLEQGLKEGKLRTDINLEIIILALNKVFHTPTNEEFLKENDLTVNQLLTDLKEIIFYGSLMDGKKKS